MDGGPALVLDYDPDSDIARIDYRSATGHRTLRSVGGYLTQSACMHSSRIHPEDQRRLAAAVRRAVERPAAEAVEYRGDYDGNGWRWYSVTWLRQIDSAGNVTRLLGRAQDITVRKAAAARFQQFKADQKNLAPDMLALARLDLTDDRILDAKGAGRRLKRVLFGNSADACLRHLRDNLPVPGERAAFDALFRRDALLTAFGQGTAICGWSTGFCSSPISRFGQKPVRLLGGPGHRKSHRVLRRPPPAGGPRPFRPDPAAGPGLHPGFDCHRPGPDSAAAGARRRRCLPAPPTAHSLTPISEPWPPLPCGRPCGRP